MFEKITEILQFSRDEIGAVQKIVIGIPHLNLLSQQFSLRPDWAMTILTTLQESSIGKEILSALRSPKISALSGEQSKMLVQIVNLNQKKQN